MEKVIIIEGMTVEQIENAYTHLTVQITGVNTLKGYPKAKLIAHLEKSLNAFIAKTKKEEVL